MVGIKLNKSDFYIKWADNLWYETTKTPTYIFKDRAEAMQVIEQMGKHYQYRFTLSYDDGTAEEFISTLKKPKPKSVKKVSVKLNLKTKKIKLKKWNNF